MAVKAETVEAPGPAPKGAIGPIPRARPRPLTDREERWRAFRLAAWLGWQLESNWTDVTLFVGYNIAKPVAGAMILVAMYWFVAGRQGQVAAFAETYVGNAFYTYIFAITFGMSWVVMEDREWFQMFKYVYTARVRLLYYMAGRAVAKFLVTSVSVLVLILFGRYALGLPIRLAWADVPMFAALLGLGVLTAVALGIGMAGVMMVTTRNAQAYSEAVAGLFYLASGVLYRIDILPGWLQVVARGLPFTYWTEGLRRILLGGSMSRVLSGISDMQILWLMAASLIGFGALCVGFFRACERTAWRRGLIDQQTNF